MFISFIVYILLLAEINTVSSRKPGGTSRDASRASYGNVRRNLERSEFQNIILSSIAKINSNDGTSIVTEPNNRSLFDYNGAARSKAALHPVNRPRFRGSLFKNQRPIDKRRKYIELRSKGRRKVTKTKKLTTYVGSKRKKIQNLQLSDSEKKMDNITDSLKQNNSAPILRSLFGSKRSDYIYQLGGHRKKHPHKSNKIPISKSKSDKKINKPKAGTRIYLPKEVIISKPGKVGKSDRNLNRRKAEVRFLQHKKRKTKPVRLTSKRKKIPISNFRKSRKHRRVIKQNTILRKHRRLITKKNTKNLNTTNLAAATDLPMEVSNLNNGECEISGTPGKSEELPTTDISGTLIEPKQNNSISQTTAPTSKCKEPPVSNSRKSSKRRKGIKKKPVSLHSFFRKLRKIITKKNTKNLNTKNVAAATDLPREVSNLNNSDCGKFGTPNESKELPTIDISGTLIEPKQNNSIFQSISEQPDKSDILGSQNKNNINKSTAEIHTNQPNRTTILNFEEISNTDKNVVKPLPTTDINGTSIEPKRSNSIFQPNEQIRLNHTKNKSEEPRRTDNENNMNKSTTNQPNKTIIFNSEKIRNTDKTANELTPEVSKQNSKKRMEPERKSDVYTPNISKQKEKRQFNKGKDTNDTTYSNTSSAKAENLTLPTTGETKPSHGFALVPAKTAMCCNVQIVIKLEQLYMNSWEECIAKPAAIAILNSTTKEQESIACVAECVAGRNGYLSNKTLILEDKLLEVFQRRFHKMSWVAEIIKQVIRSCVDKFSLLPLDPKPCRGTPILEVEGCIEEKLQDECNKKHIVEEEYCGVQYNSIKNRRCLLLTPGNNC